MANFGDTIVMDNSNPIKDMMDFEKSLLDPLYRELTGKIEEPVKRTLCAWTDGFDEQGQAKTVSKYLTTSEIDKDPLKYLPVRDNNGLMITRIEIESTKDPARVRIINDKGANYIRSEFRKVFNDKMLLANLTKDECVDIAADFVDRTFAYIHINELEYELTDPTQLNVTAMNFTESLYTFLTSLAEGKNRDAIVAILTGGAIQYKKEETQPQQQQYGKQIFGGK